MSSWAPCGSPDAVLLLCNIQCHRPGPTATFSHLQPRLFAFTIVFFFCFCPQPRLHSWPRWLPSSALPRYIGLFLQVREQTVCRARCPVGALPHLGFFHHCPERLFPFLAVESPSLPSFSLPFPSYPVLFLLSLSFLLSWAFVAFPLSEFAKRKAPLITEVLVGVAGLSACSCCR